MASKTSFDCGHSCRPQSTARQLLGLNALRLARQTLGLNALRLARQLLGAGSACLLAVGTADALHHFISAVGGERYDGGVKQRQHRVGQRKASGEHRSQQ